MVSKSFIGKQVYGSTYVGSTAKNEKHMVGLCVQHIFTHKLFTFTFAAVSLNLPATLFDFSYTIALTFYEDFGVSCERNMSVYILCISFELKYMSNQE